MMKFLIFTFLLLNSFSSYANFFEKKLYIYECPKNKYATCNDGCKKSDLQVSFLLNKKENTVLLKSYFKGNTNSTIFDNCKIFNDKNWDCSSKNEFFSKDRNVISHYIRKMNDGIFTSIGYTDIFTKNLETIVDSSVCAR